MSVDLTKLPVLEGVIVFLLIALAGAFTGAFISTSDGDEGENGVAPTATPPPSGETVTLSPSKDNTIFEIDDSLSNGSGQYLFTGRSNQEVGSIRRALIAFDLSAADIPDGASIQSVTLSMNMSKTVAPENTVELYPLLSDWGEGASDAEGEEGRGAQAESDDATWINTFFDTETWDIEGGDFSDTASASLAVGGPGEYDFSSDQMVVDVESWLADPASNFGWAIVGDESERMTAKRFDSRESENPPVLTIEFSADGEPGGEPPAGGDTIVMGDNFFEFGGERDPNITISAGEEVTFTLDNAGAAIHNMQVNGTDDTYEEDVCEVGGANNGCSDPNAVPGGTQATIAINISEPGTYNFRCDFHPVEMVGTLTVQ